MKGGTLFQIEVCERGSFSGKMVYKKVKGLDLRAEPACIKLGRVPLPLGSKTNRVNER